LLPTYLAWLAESYDKIGRPAEGLGLVNEALSAETQSGYHYWTAELLRLKGPFILGSGLVEQDAESCFLEAIEIARRQRAKLFELRAAMSLSRLWARQGKSRAAHGSLADVYNWFTDGLDTTDVSGARSLLQDLERRANLREMKGQHRAHPGKVQGKNQPRTRGSD
jgi:adenylate cyclase